MKFKFHWGWGIAVFMLLFFASIIIRIIISSNIEVDLISKDYYHKELNYEQEIQKKKNTESLSEKIILKTLNDSICLIFPSTFKQSNLKGIITFYCASKTNKDQCFEVSVDSLLRQNFPKQIFSEKRYTIKIDWNSEGTFYYQDFELDLN